MGSVVQSVEWLSGNRKVTGSISGATGLMIRLPWARQWTPNSSWWAGWFLAWQLSTVCACLIEWMRGYIVKYFGQKCDIKAPFTFRNCYLLLALFFFTVRPIFLHTVIVKLMAFMFPLVLMVSWKMGTAWCAQAGCGGRKWHPPHILN